MMKIFFVCLYLTICLCACLTVNGQTANSEVTASLKLGEQTFSIVREGEDPDFSYIVKLNNRSVTVINNRFADVEGYFDLIDLNKIVVLNSANGGNACPKKLLLVAFNDAGLVTVTPEFGNCHETPTYIINSDSIKINFPFGNNPIAESWIYGQFYKLPLA